MWGAHNSQKICRIRVGSKSKEFLSQIPKRAQFLCASKLFQAVESSDHHKYRLLYFREYCTFDGFAPAIPNAVYTCPLSVISSCPEYLSGWKVAVQCASDRTEYVHNMGRIYRNPACAICNVESDDSLDLSLLSWAKEDLLSSLTNLYQTNNDDQFGLRFDGYSIFCCRSCPEKFSMCSNVNVTSWGSILHPITKHCLPVPFRTDCDQIPSGNLMLNIDLQELCPQFYDMCPESTTTTLLTSTIPTNRTIPGSGSGNGVVPSIVGDSPYEVAFDPRNSEIQPTEIIKTDPVEDNTTYLLCGNGSIRDPEMEVNHRTLQLHRGIIKVCHTRLSVIDTCSMKLPSTIIYPWLDFGFPPRGHSLGGAIEGRLSHFCRWLWTGWQGVISQTKIPWNTPPWLGIEPGLQGGQTVSYPTELSWHGLQGGQTVSYSSELSWLTWWTYPFLLFVQGHVVCSVVSREPSLEPNASCYHLWLFRDANPQRAVRKLCFLALQPWLLPFCWLWWLRSPSNDQPDDFLYDTRSWWCKVEYFSIPSASKIWHF